ncbi:hypothetical protein WJX72_002975 [[Myrmecia] bisecta]|uniref:LOV domain-containing protein n=1 Tax=[Myrmecia] bisecta TaxID=41462 RepID=A0AAW1PHI8_9CHLO
MDSVKEGITIADYTAPDMPLIYANEAFARITGYAVEEAIGKNCRFLQGPGTDTQTLDSIRSATRQGRPSVTQLMNYKKNGDAFVNYLSVTPIHDSTGKLTHYVGIQSDITELVNHKKAELAAKHEAVQAAAATEAKSQFLARMSHEIRTPLNGMIAVGQLLAETALSPTQWDLVNTIRCSGETLLTLITDILDFSRIEANKMVLSMNEFRLQTVIEAAMEIAGLHAAQKRLQVAYHIADDVPRVILGDAQRLQQILLNVLNNAVKFTEHGEILLESTGDDSESGKAMEAAQIATAAALKRRSKEMSRQSSLESAELGNSDQAYVIQFSVRDSGIGISQDDLGRLFQSFSQVDASPTRRYGGSGLGLAISQKLCEAMGGSMWAESGGLGRGSTFRWTLAAKAPLKPLMRQQHRQSVFAMQPPSLGERVPAPVSPSMECTCGGDDDDMDEGNTVMQLRHGKRALLVEPSDVVRKVLALALCSWRMPVCAVKTEQEAIAKLALRGGVKEMIQAGKRGILKPPIGAGLRLKHSATTEDSSDLDSGPFDVVIMDMTMTKLLGALMRSDEGEAQRVVFMGWPGQNEPDEEALPSTPDSTTVISSAPSARGPPVSAQPPKALAEEVQKSMPGGRQLGYVIVTRPVRQGRLKLALEEVLVSQLEDSPPAWNEDQQLDEPDASDSAAGSGSLASSDVAETSGEEAPHAADSPALRLASSDSIGDAIKRVASGGQLKRAQVVKKSGSGSDLGDIEGRRARLRIMLAEDNMINMKVALGILRRMGYNDVVMVTDGLQALQELDKRGGADAFDIILMDLHMPHKGGMEVVAEIRHQWPSAKVRVVAVTADAFEDTRDMCLKNGFDAWLAKPFRIEDLGQIVDSALARFE